MRYNLMDSNTSSIVDTLVTYHPITLSVYVVVVSVIGPQCHFKHHTS